MTRVAPALVIHELRERTRDRWVVVVTGVFALLSLSIALYGSSAADTASVVAAPSLMTLSAFLVPLVALVLGHDAIVGEQERNTLGLLLSLPVSRSEVLLAKYVGRLLALVLAIGLGLGLAATQLGGGQAATVGLLVPRTILLGASFLSVGVMVSVLTRHTSTAASIAVVLWFMFVFLYDLGLLGALVITDGAMSVETVRWLVHVNPAGLYRSELLWALTGSSGGGELGMSLTPLSAGARTGLWATWILGPLVVGGVVLSRRRSVAH